MVGDDVGVETVFPVDPSSPPHDPSRLSPMSLTWNSNGPHGASTPLLTVHVRDKTFDGRFRKTTPATPDLPPVWGLPNLHRLSWARSLRM